jgi:RNA polymerase sigma-70 factor (ECF subfamily)
VFREEAGRLTASLVRLLGDFDLAEELVADAVVAALETWPRDGVPERPGAWLFTTARRKAIDQLRRQARLREKVALLGREPVRPVADDRLRLIFTCCHPALSREAQIALTLRAVCGLTTAEIARAFILPEPTVAQRIVRAKRKIVAAGIAYRVPRDEEMGERLEQVLAVLYLLFNEGYLASSVVERRDFSRDAEWLCALLSRLLPREPEVLGLLALMRLHLARARARFDAAGALVRLQDQDRGLWDRSAIVGAGRLIARAAILRRPGPYQVQAAIAVVHAEAPSWRETDWLQIVALYGLLVELAPSPVVRLNRAIALWHVSGPATALAEVEALSSDLGAYNLFHATRAELLRDLGRGDEARQADERALALTGNPAERALIESRLGGC